MYGGLRVALLTKILLQYITVSSYTIYRGSKGRGNEKSHGGVRPQKRTWRGDERFLGVSKNGQQNEVTKSWLLEMSRPLGTSALLRVEVSRKRASKRGITVVEYLFVHRIVHREKRNKKRKREMNQSRGCDNGRN